MQKSFILLIFSMSFLLLTCNKEKVIKKDPLTRKLDSLIINEHKANRFDGTIVIGTRDSVFYENAIGTANRVWNIPMRMDHRFDICSLNKSFISALVLIAVEEGKLSLDGHLTDYLNGYEYTGNFNKDITLHQMLTHTSGLPDYGKIDAKLSDNNFRIFKRKHFTNSKYVEFISNIPPVNEPDKQFYYSNFAYHLLAILLEDAYQMPFPELWEQKICNPLDLELTFSSVSNKDVFEEVVEGYSYQESSKNWQRNQFIDLTLGRRIFSTSRDLYAWGKAMSSDALLSEKYRNMMLTNHLTEITPDISYGYGWVIFDGKGNYKMGDLGIDKKYFIHGGATEGYKSMLINIENGEYIIAFLANIGNQTNEIDLAKKIVNILMTSENEK